MKFSEFLAHARKVNGLDLDRLAKEVGGYMVLYPSSYLDIIEKALAPVENPEVIRWEMFKDLFEIHMPLDRAVVIVTHSRECTKLLGTEEECMSDADKGFCLAICNGLDCDESFIKYCDFDQYWKENGSVTFKHCNLVYMVDHKAINEIINNL